MSRLGRAKELGRAMTVMAGAHVRFDSAVVLGYHDVQPRAEIGTDYTVTPGLLRTQLAEAQAWGLQFVTLQELTTSWLRREPLDGLACVVFDDALVGVHRHAAHVLGDLRIPGTLFPLTEGLGQKPAWWPGSARTMTAGELTDLLALGWGVGSHTRTHASLPRLAEVALREEIFGSREALQDSTGHTISTIAYPFGHHDERVRDLCREAGYDVGFTFLNGRITADEDAFKLPRLTMTMRSRGLRWAYHLTRAASSWPDTQSDRVGGAIPGE